jgi:ribosomal protein L40E
MIQMSVSGVFKNFKQIEISKNCYIHPNIPAKKLQNCIESYCFSGVQVDFLLDDTIWGSAKDGMAISNGQLYYKQIGEGPKSLNLSTVKKFTYEKRMLGNIELFIDDMPFVTVTGFDKAYHEILVNMLNACVEEARRLSVAETKPKSQPKAKKEPVKAPESEVDTLQCPECDAQIPIDAKFCHECGLQIPPKDICGQCQSKLPAKAKFCPKCGESADVKQTHSNPVVDPVSLRADLTQWLSDAEQEAWIDSDGDMSLRIRRGKPNFASEYRAWCSKHDITIISEGERQEQTDSACFNGDDEFLISSPYCRVGRLPSAQYEASVDASFFVLKAVEVHEIELKEGALKIPKLGSNKISISSLSARKDNDGSYGLEYELSAYPGHIVNFEFSSEKPDADANVWGRHEEEPTQTGTNWLWDVKPGQKIYLTFGEFEPLVDGIKATFSGDAKPSEGAYDNAEDGGGDGGSAWLDDVPSSGNDDVDAILNAAADRMLELDWFEDSITNGGHVDKLMLFLTGEPDEFSVGVRLALTVRQDELDENELQEIQSAVDTYFDLNDIKTKLMTQGYDWTNLAGIECETAIMGNSGRSGSSGNMSGDGESVTALFEWHMFRGSVNIDDMEDDDERDAAKRAVILVEEGEQEAARHALPALWFEYNMDNLDSSPDEFMPSDQQVYFEVNYANPDHDIVLDYDDGTLILTATIRFPMQINPGVDEDEINDWLSENGGYAAGFISANWSYNGDEGGHFVFRELAENDWDDGYRNNSTSDGDADFKAESIRQIRDKLASGDGVSIFIAEEAGQGLRNELVRDLIDDGARLISIERGQSLMEYVTPLLEVEEGHTAILDAVQNIDDDAVDDFLRIVTDRVLVGTIGEGDGAQSFEAPLTKFNLVLVDHGSEDFSLGTLRMRQVTQLVITDDEVLTLDEDNDADIDENDHEGSCIPGEVEQYIRVNDDGSVSAVIVYTVVENADENVIVHGAYYGYCGGGVNEGGYFVINHEDDDVRALDYSDIDEIEADDPRLGGIYNSLMQQVWTLISEDDGALQLSIEGAELLAESGDSECCMSSGFDGDALDEVSKLWHLTLHFES